MADEGLLHRIERRSADIAIDDAERAERQLGERLARPMMGRARVGQVGGFRRSLSGEYHGRGNRAEVATSLVMSTASQWFKAGPLAHAILLCNRPHCTPAAASGMNGSFG